MAWQVYAPIISTWLDVRSFRGTNLTTLAGSSFKSTISFVKSYCWLTLQAIWTNASSSPFRYVSSIFDNGRYIIGYNASGANSTAWTNKMNNIFGITRALETIGGSNNFYCYLDPSSSNKSIYGVLFPSRPLEKDPIASEECNATVSTSISGISYRTSYAHRRVWKVSTLIDGPADKDRTDFFQDVRSTNIQNFFKLAEAGVTIHLQGRGSSGLNNLDLLDRSIRSSSPYIGCPNSICGQLTGASWSLQGQDDKAFRYKLDLTIDEDPTTTKYV